MNVNPLAVLLIRLLGALETGFACMGCAASASANVVAAARSHLQHVTAGPPPPTRTEDIADVIVLSRGPKNER